MKLDQPDWGDNSLSISLSGELREEGLHFYFLLNAFWEPLTFELPELPAANSWRRWIDTSLDSPDDIVVWDDAPTVPGRTYRVADRSVVMLFSNTDGSEVNYV
jgi:isoamylase